MDLGLNFQLNLGNENTVSPKKHTAPPSKALKIGPVCDLQLSLLTGPLESIVTNMAPVSAQQQNSQETSLSASPAQTTDEEVSTPSGWTFGSNLLPAINSTIASSGFTLHQNTP